MGRILVVDDDNDILKLAEQVLASAGHVVVTAGDAMRAMDLLSRLEFDMLISDANMPHYSGFDLVSTVRKNSNLSHMSVAMLTGLRERKDVEKAVKAGVDDYIIKPIDPMLLIQKVAALFEKKPPAQYPEIVFSSLEEGHRKASLVLNFDLVSLSELGVVALTDFQMPSGHVIDLQCEFFKELAIEPPPVKVLSSEFDESLNKWRINFIYLGAHEAYLTKVRKWLRTHGATNAPATTKKGVA